MEPAFERVLHPPALIPMKVRELLRRLQGDGWYLARTRGSHRQYKHETKPGLVTVPGHLGDDVAPRTLKSILNQAGLSS
jgi:predicted RNA binding protein YcfA (HicA-like mRNA interferase family)